jgi:lysophospholipid acyltransferase (LPLAT)-like uncharacterized protein
MPRTADRLAGFLAPRVGYWYIRLLHATMRLEYRGRETLDRARQESERYILAFWHSRFAMMPYCYPDQRIAVVISRHRDARLLAEILMRFGYDMAWGSSTRGGVAALREVVRKMKDGYDSAFTPDGPRGPRRRVQAGVIVAARLSGKPIIPVAFSARPARRLRSWDRTLVPYPFSKGLYLYGAPMRVARKADEEEQERFRASLEDELDRLTDRADEQVGLPLEEPREEGEAS